MNNLIYLIGRIVSDPEINETENGTKECMITLAIARNFKNEDGIYETDFIPCALLGMIATNVKEYCKKGDLVGIKGRIEKLTKEEEIKIVAEKVTFLSSNKMED